MRLFFTLLFLLVLGSLQAQNTTWVQLGEHNYTEGYTIPYRLELYTPKGTHRLDDIKQGLQKVRIDVVWLPPVTEQAETQLHFKQLLYAQFPEPEDLYFNQTLIDKFIRTLPAANRFDRWRFIYSPDAGTQLLIEDQLIYQLIGSEINRALRKAWLLKDPVTTSKLLKRLIKKRANS